MPNWVFSTLNIEGKPEDLERFRQKAIGLVGGEERKLSFDKFIPYPETYRKMDEEYQKLEDAKEDLRNIKSGFASGGYEWRLENWGTKWDASDVDGEDHSGEDIPYLVYFFTTAWAPALPVIEKMADQFPMLCFSFGYEEETGWGGELVIHKEKDVHGFSEYEAGEEDLDDA